MFVPDDVTCKSKSQVLHVSLHLGVKGVMSCLRQSKWCMYRPTSIFNYAPSGNHPAHVVNKLEDIMVQLREQMSAFWWSIRSIHRCSTCVNAHFPRVPSGSLFISSRGCIMFLCGQEGRWKVSSVLAAFCVQLSFDDISFSLLYWDKSPSNLTRCFLTFVEPKHKFHIWGKKCSKKGTRKFIMGL